MVCDGPVIVYNADKKKHTKSEMDDLVKRWKAKKEREEKAGKKVDLNEFVAGAVPNKLV